MALDPTGLDLPSKPGVYLFRRADERVTYVGKATDLRSRVRSYFAPNPDRRMVPRLVEDSDRVDFIVTKSPSDALILERQLIRKHKPRYNSMLKDDKSYPFIALTAHAMAGDQKKAIEAGCDDYDTKPVELPRLLEKIGALVGETAE